jgi:unsaturated rhamnogalacturonyl hydrolase
MSTFPKVLLSTVLLAVASGLGPFAGAKDEPRFPVPTFAAHEFPITDYGAKPEGDCTEALAQAIAACHAAAGGGRVIVPAGVWLTGAVHLLSKVDLHLADGATLRFYPEPEYYLPVVLTRFEGIECMNYSPLIYANGQEDVAITGSGTLDGSASEENWWSWASKASGQPAKQAADRAALTAQGEAGVPVAERVYGAGHFLRPSFIEFFRCANVLVGDVHIVRSPMWEIHPVLCTDVIVIGVQIRSLGPNNDGCDPESCRDVRIENCVFETGDDCIAIKSGRNNDGRRIGMPTENVLVQHCTMKDGHGGVTIGSEISGGCRNVVVEDCDMDSPHLDRAFRFKSNAQRGGVIEGVVFRNVRIGRVARAVLSVEFDYEEGAKGPYPPVVRDVLLENITSQESPRVVAITSFPGATIEGVRMINCTFRGVKMDDLLKDAAAPERQNVTIEPAPP